MFVLPFLQPDQVDEPLHAYQLSKRGNALRVKAEAVRWGKRGARVTTISPGIIITPLARDESRLGAARFFAARCWAGRSPSQAHRRPARPALRLDRPGR